MPGIKKKLGFAITKTDKVVYSCYDPKRKEAGRWSPLIIKDWGDKSLYASPMSVGLNYARSVFEGMKAYRHKDGKIFLFRPEENAKRFANSLKGLLMPPFPEEDFLKAVKLLVRLNAKHVPGHREGSLYLRPVAWGNDGLGYAKHPETTFTVCFWCSPVGEYYSEGLQSIAVWIARGITRATPGGVGCCKASGNYEISTKAKELAGKEGCVDALFLDGKTETHIEELGAANIFVVKNNVLYTPFLRDTILAGIIRKSIIELAREELHLQVYEKDISVKGAIEADEVFVTGTAAIVTSIGEIKDGGKFYTIGDGEAGTITRKLYELLTGIQYGELPDKYKWLVAIK